MDPSGIGFAFGGIYPGTLHAKGKYVETHKVSYSIGKVGTYLLHVRLRQQAVPLPGSPFTLKVSPNAAHAVSTTLPNVKIHGLVGVDPNAGCGVTIQSVDVMGNQCVAGGAPLSGDADVPKGTIGPVISVTVKDNGDGTYYFHWKSKVCGEFPVSIKIGPDHISGSPTTVSFMSIAPLHTKTVLSGDGLVKGVAGQPSKFRIKFFDEFDNRATPGPEHVIGIALLQGKELKPKDVQGAGQEYEMTPVDDQKGEYEITYTPDTDGTYSLHVWTDITKNTLLFVGKERYPLPRSPFQCIVVAGKASAAMSFVDGWMKESRAVDKQGKIIERPDLIVAGDAVICRPVICDALGNKTVPEPNALQIFLSLPDGTMQRPDAFVAEKEKHEKGATGKPSGGEARKAGGRGGQEGGNGGEGRVGGRGGGEGSLKVLEVSKGGFTTYDIRHDVSRSGKHKVHIQLDGREIKGSPVLFEVQPAFPDVKAAKLFAPIESPLYPNKAYTILLKTYDRFGNAIPNGGLAVAARLQIIKASAHDLTTLVPNNHSVEVVDNEDGTYAVSVSLINLAATVKAIVNMDKNLPANGGELPAIQLSFELPPPTSSSPPK